jgi:branched-chain amino acid aminotransferase
VAYFNGKIVPESDVLIPFRDRGFMAGDAAFDTARTFNHKIFKLKEHIDRLYHSLRYLQIDPQIPAAELTAVTEEVLSRNLHLIDKDEDYWVSQRVSRGLNSADRSPRNSSGPTVIVECQPLPLKHRARLYRDGNYLNLIMGDLEAKAADPESWAVLLDANGNLAEGTGSNIFVVRDGVLLTPEARYVLPGISRETVLELARDLKIPVRETSIDLYDAYTADEAFLTSTSLCICPVRSINGRHVGVEKIAGPLTQHLIDAYAKLVEFDFVAQYKRHLNG